MKTLLKAAAVDIKRTHERQRKYNLQDSLSLAKHLSPALTALIPSRIKHKIVGFEIHHHMQLTAVKPAHRLDRLRWLTLARGQVLRSAIIQQLHTQGWRVQPGQAHVTARHDSDGHILIKFDEPAESPTQVTADLRTANETKPGLIWPLLSQQPHWSAPLQKQTAIGFEYSRFHGVHFGASFTDIERFTIAYPETFDGAQVESLARTSGYEKTGARSFIHESTGHRWSLKMETDQSSNVIIHGQHRWGDPTTYFKRR
ncbi:MAG: hypothetical protein CMH52_03705 [Myxococcales bacterium]|nr:hypothetical protein [Myxococcales bacterium]